MTIPLGSRVRWSHDGVVHDGCVVQGIPAGQLPTVPASVARHRRRFICEASDVDRVLVRVETTTRGSFYYAPHAEGVTVVPVRVRRMARA